MVIDGESNSDPTGTAIGFQRYGSGIGIIGIEGDFHDNCRFLAPDFFLLSIVGFFG